MMNHRLRCLLSIIIFASLITTGSLSRAADPAPPVADAPPLERSPYRVQLLLAFDPMGLDQAARTSIVRDLDQTALRCLGDLWSLRVSEVTWLHPVNQRGIERVDFARVKMHDPQATADIWYLAAVEARPVGFRVSVRSWQPDVQVETRPTSFEVMDERDLAVRVLRHCHELTRPMGIVEHVEDRTVRMRMRAGDLSPPDSSFADLAHLDVLVPMLAYRNKDQVIEKLQPIPWTYITIDESDGSTVMGTVQSGLKLALGGKKRGRIDTLVVGVQPEYRSTRLELYTQGKPSLPLMAHRLEIREKSVIPRPTDANPDVDPNSTLMGEELTNRLGETEIFETSQPLVWLFAYSGQHLLAKVPFVPGAARSIRLEVPDDSLRLAAEADVQMLQGEVIDAVALRNTAIATIRAAAKKDDWATVNQKLELLKGQQNMKILLERLTAVRVAGVAAARASRDKVAEARIARLCDEAVNLINTHLGNDKVKILAEEMEALQNAEAEPRESLK